MKEYTYLTLSEELEESGLRTFVIKDANDGSGIIVMKANGKDGITGLVYGMNNIGLNVIDTVLPSDIVSLKTMVNVSTYNNDGAVTMSVLTCQHGDKLFFINGKIVNDIEEEIGDFGKSFRHLLREQNYMIDSEITDFIGNGKA